MKSVISGALALSMVCGLAVGGAWAQSLDDVKAKAQKALQDAGKTMEKSAKDAVKTAMGDTAAPMDLSAPLPTDPRLVTGTLDNGMKYMVVKHSNPPGRANMYIHVSSGSLNETDAQRGIAHYLEHMAFNGSENFPPGSVVDLFQSMGLTFGQHQNAFTSFDQTTYILSFPDTKPETMDRGMRFFSDVATRLTLTQAEIDKERQVILEEKRTRLGAQQRVQEFVLERLIPGSLIGSRLPIGVEDTLLKMNRADFVDYYSRWYVPSNMTVIVVADAEPSDVAVQISKSFSGGEKKPKPVDNDVGVKPYSQSRAIVAHDPELTEAQVSIVSVKSKDEPITTVGAMRRDMIKDIATSAFNRRIGTRLTAGGTSYTGASAMAMNLFNAASLRQVGAQGEPGKWKDMIGEVGMELRKASLHGFTQREIDDVKTQMKSSAERFVEQEKTLPATGLIRSLNNSVATGDTVVGAQQELDLYTRLLPTVTRDEVNTAFTEMFGAEHVTFVAQMPSSVPGGVPTEAQVLALGKDAMSVTPKPDVEAARATELMASKPTPGNIVDTAVHPASGVRSVWLDNGVRVHFRNMDIRKDTAWVQINLAAGQIQESAATRGIADVAALAWSSPGTRMPSTAKLSSSDVRDLMTGKKVNVSGGGGPDVMSVVVTGNPTELETGMQLAHLMLTQPKIEAGGFDQWKTSTLQSIEGRKTNPQAAVAETMMQTMFPADEARTQMLGAEQVKALSVEKAQQWLDNAVKTAPIEVSIVGDISAERAMELATTYLGSLPKRERISSSTLDNLRTLKKRPGPIVNKRELDTKTPLAVAINAFYGPDAENVPDTRMMQLASRVLSTRAFKKIREEEQLAYSPGVRLQPGDTYPGFGAMLIFAPTEPGKLDRLLTVGSEMFAEFAKSGPTEEEMTTAKKQVANQLDETMKQPDFWLARLGTLDYRNTKLDDVVGANDYYQSLTGEQVRTAFNTYYKPEAVMQVVVKPAKVEQPSEGASPTGGEKPKGEKPAGG